MNPIPKSQSFIHVTVLLCSSLLLNACDRPTNLLKANNMSNLSARIQPLFEKTKTVCFGHFLLDIPVTATVVYGPANVYWPIEYYPGEASNVAQHLESLAREVEDDRQFLDQTDLANLSMFGKVVDGAMPGQKLIFGSKDHATYSVSSLIPIGTDLFLQQADGVLSIEEQIAVLNTVARKIRLRAENEVPSEPGACIEGGFVAWQPQFERIGIGVRLKEFPDVHFSIDATKKDILVESDALEPRLEQAEQDAKKEGLGLLFARIKTLRRGSRQVGEWDGFEMLARKPPHKDETEAHEFLFLSQGLPRDPLHPVLDVQLNTGVRDNQTANVKPSVTDDEAVALWDKLTSSIRVRPTGSAAKQDGAAPPKAPLGTFIDTGGICPQTGWWQCSDHGEVAGTRRRHFFAHEPLPHATLLDRPSAWQKLTGQRPTHQVATTWELVEYEAVPAEESLQTAAVPELLDTEITQTKPLRDNGAAGAGTTSEG